jgi:glycosyltransferase involved in cell wall biosynthesis
MFSILQKLLRFLGGMSALVRAVPRLLAGNRDSLWLVTRRAFGVLRREGVGGVALRARRLTHSIGTDRRQWVSSFGLYGEARSLAPGFMPKVSIIVPNFNHAEFLPERLDSIDRQTYGNVEVILLDDCSGDESVEILRDYARRHPDKTICRFNEVNSGGVFSQWKKGLELASGELVWIAESDDYCTANLLEELVRYFQNPAVMLALARSDFVRGIPARRIRTSEDYLADLGLGGWDKPFIRAAHSLVKDGWAVGNIVPNASAVVFRNPGKVSLLDDRKWLQMRLCGDWMFYLSLVRGGLVAYSPNATNFYRQHGTGTSVNVQKETSYYREFEVIARHLLQNYALEYGDLVKQRRYLYEHWCSRYGGSRREEFERLYDLDRVWPHVRARKPNLVMAVYALIAGGGETFPITLANLLYDRGYAITLLNFRVEPTEPGVREMLSPSIPLLELEQGDLLGAAFKDLGVEIVHSHHAWADLRIAPLLLHEPQIKHVVSLHGMYETMDRAQIWAQTPLLERVDSFVYAAEKNLSSFPRKFIDERRFDRIDNALPTRTITPVERATLGLGEEDFVLCLVSRAIPEKGWEEAIEAVNWANARSDRDIHLLLIGDGPEYERLRVKKKNDFFHFLGFRANIRDYLAASDIGFLPSRFKGESFPLVVIDCLLSGKPVLATDIGEVRYMLNAEGGLAGELFDLVDGDIESDAVGQMIVSLANDPQAYERVLRNVPLAAKKFDVTEMVNKYEIIYKRVAATSAAVAEIGRARQSPGETVE